MSAALALQWLLVLLAVLASSVYAASYLFPHAASRLQRWLVIRMLRPQRAAWVRGLGRRLAPTPTAQVGAAGCASCAGPKSCGASEPVLAHGPATLSPDSDRPERTTEDP